MTRRTTVDSAPARSARAAVAQLVAERLDLDAIAAELDRLRAVQPLVRTMEVWDLSHGDVARMFGVSRQAVAKWIAIGVPSERAASIADLAAATDLLVRHLKRDRIAAVVRRPAEALDGRTLLDLATAGETAAVLSSCRDMFAFGGVGS